MVLKYSKCDIEIERGNKLYIITCMNEWYLKVSAGVRKASATKENATAGEVNASTLGQGDITGTHGE